MIFEKIRERLQDVIDVIEVYTAGRLLIDNADISVMRLQQIANKLKSIKETEYNNGWIPCSERLPIGEEYRKIIDGSYFYKHMLTTTNENDIPICVGWYDQENEVWYDLEGFAFYPIAWQPLPEPYTPKGE